MGKYNYLFKTVKLNKRRKDSTTDNFYSIDELNISRAEKRIGYKFPNGLKEFWLEVGEGVLYHGNREQSDMAHNNTFMSPKEIADIILLREESGLAIAPYFEDILDNEPELMPFFEVGDSYDFLYMKPQSEDPEVIYDDMHRIIAKNMEEFVHKLYYESPDFYLHVGEGSEGEARESEDEK